MAHIVPAKALPANTPTMAVSRFDVMSLLPFFCFLSGGTGKAVVWHTVRIWVSIMRIFMEMWQDFM